MNHNYRRQPTCMMCRFSEIDAEEMAVQDIADTSTPLTCKEHGGEHCNEDFICDLFEELK